VEELLTLADIGRMFGVTRQAAGKWAKGDGFPAPHGMTGTGRVWKRKDVEAWARRNGRVSRMRRRTRASGAEIEPRGNAVVTKRRTRPPEEVT
jgi:hypothetical protein